MMTVVRAIAELGPSQVTVLLTGESGVGKEVVAKALHWASPRRGKPFVAINCAAIPETLLEAEFFGHEKGAFTGALAAKPGRFERATGGTLFLDEVGDMSAILQAKLLRALEEREIERLGGAGPIPVDVRVLAATNQPLEARVASGDFREDLFYRLAVARLRIPPLRERREDLPELVVFFVRRFSQTYGRQVRGVTDDALRVLSSHDWPGNVRELRNVLDRAVMSSHGGWIRSDDLPMGADAPSISSARAGGPTGYPPTTPLEEVERDHIARVLEFTHGALAEAAEILGIHRNTLTRKLDRFGLRARGSA
jgi:Nif-specific regulatory protein